jgi:putative hydrolase of the HAD superfamily
LTISAITFDFWQTLYRNRPVDADSRLRQMQSDLLAVSGHSFAVPDIKAAVNVARKAWSTTWVTENRTLTAEEWLTIMLEALNAPVDSSSKKQLATGMEESILQTPPMVIKEVPAMLVELSNQYPLAIISDTGITPGRVLRRILESDGLLGYFSQLTFSDELGRSKPHPDAFLSTLTPMNAKPATAVHIGDLLRTDILGAKSVGMRAVQYIGVNQDDWSMNMEHAPEVTVVPDAVINHHTELPALLKQWSS